MPILARDTQFNFRTSTHSLEIAKKISKSNNTTLSSALNAFVEYVAETGELPNFAMGTNYEPVSKEIFELSSEDIFATYDDLFRKLVDM